MKTKNPPTTVPEVIAAMRYPVLFRSGDTSAALIQRGTYTYVDDLFVDPRNLLLPPPQSRFMLEVISLGKPVSTRNALGYMKQLGKQPALPQHLFALGCQYIHVLKELREIMELKEKQSYSRKSTPYEDKQIKLIEQILPERLSIVCVGKSMTTRVTDLEVFPCLTYGGGFGKGTNLIGHHVDMGRIWGPQHFFLTITPE